MKGTRPWAARIIFTLGLSFFLGACASAPGDASGDDGIQASPGAYEYQSSFVKAKLRAKPPLFSNSPDAAFKFSCTGGPCTYKCNLDALGWEKCKAKQTYLGLAEGGHIILVKATDSSGASSKARSYSWTIDLTEPETTISSNPADPTNATTASFEFNSNETSSTFECQLDFGPWVACSSPDNHTGLLEGSHSFQVRAIDPASNVDSTPSGYGWEVDTTAPETSLISWPPNPSNSVNAAFMFSCNEAICTFQCNLDSSGWGACTSPKNYLSLGQGSHTVQVRATDAVTNQDSTPAGYTWNIDTVPPDTSITSNPANPTQSSSASFTFTCTGACVSYECQIDYGGFSVCVSGKSYSSLSEDDHNFQVRAKDAAGNTDPSPAAYSWTRDITAPDTAITVPLPPNPSSSTSASFSFVCLIDTVCSFECKLDGAGWSACVSPKGYSALTGGSHTFYVRATDAANNVDSTPAIYTWSITNVWLPINSSGVPSARMDHTAVWTGTQMIVWGGYNGSYLNTGGKYDPATDSWSATTTGGAPSARRYHTAVWTGTLMVVWGGWNGAVLNTGGGYNPSTNSWTATTTTGVPAAREMHTAVWAATPNRMIIWGGADGTNYLNSGANYDPTGNSWSATSTALLSSRSYHTAVWTGTRMIVWGGWNAPSYFNSGGIYDQSANSWTYTTGTGAPSARSDHAAVWAATPNRMIIWGGDNGSPLNTGGIFDPTGNSWSATTTTGAPTARLLNNRAVWTGTRMIVWGGYNGVYLNSGGKYDPATNSWSDTSQIGAPCSRRFHTAVWAGNRMIIWGGYTSGSSYPTDGGRYWP